MKADDILKNFAASNSVLEDLRTLLEDCRRLSPKSALEHLNVGAREASSVHTLAVTAYRKGFISRADLAAAMTLVEAWLAFDDDVLALVAEAIPVVPRNRSESMVH